MPKLSNKNCSQNTSVPNPLNKSSENAGQNTSTLETGSSCKDRPLPKDDGLDTSTSASLCKDYILDLPSSSYQRWITPPIGDLPHQPVKKFPETANGKKKNEHSSLAGLRSVPGFTMMRSTTAHSALFVPRHITNLS